MISFNKRLFTFFALLCLSGLVGAQSAKIEEGFDYRILPIAQPVETKGKVEVIEFFWYGCPHCYDFEPELSAWVKRQPKDVVFRRVPVAFRDDFMPHSQLFYTLESMGKGDALNEKVMYAIHKENKRLLKQLTEAYRIDGVPTIVMQGRYVTSPSIAGTKAKAIAVMDYLEEKIRKDKYK